MKLYRYMSAWEFIRMSMGKEIKPYVYDFEARTSSKGLCFLGEKTFVNDGTHKGEFTPVECLDFLKGIVNDDVLVEFESENNENIRETYGEYANPFNDDYDDYNVAVTEYCMMSYQKDFLKPKRYLFPNYCKSEYTEYVDGKIDIKEIIKHTSRNNLMRFSLLPQMPKGKGFWTEVEYAEPGLGEEITNDEWRRKKLVYGDLGTQAEECSIDIVLDSVSDDLEDKFVRIVLNGECPASWEVLVNDFKNTMEEKGSQTGTFGKNSVEEHFSDFSKFVALCTVYPGLEKYYELHDIKEYASTKERTRLIYD